uniref:Uncharacterized protein n=1 Tax=Anguilla anguilla TaxID=7936 RepID=A0A0E9XFI4_ANGAN
MKPRNPQEELSFSLSCHIRVN